MSTVIDAIMRLKDEFSPVLKQVNNNMSEHSKIQKRITKDIEKTGAAVTGMGKKFALIAAPLAGAALGGLKLHAAFEDGMAKVSTLVDTTKVSIQGLSDGVRKVSDETGQSVTDLAEAEYQMISAGVDAAHATEFLGTAAKAAKAGFTDNSTAINGLTNILNAYGMKSEEVEKISDQMLVTQNLGKTTFGEMAQSMGNVTPIAAQLGVSTDELFASMAALTKNGIQTSESVTGLKAAYSNILKPTAEASKMAQSLGLEFNAAHLKSVGWAKFLAEVKEKTGGNSETMAQLFGSVEALNGIMVLTGKSGSKDFADALHAMGDSSGATLEAFNKLQTPAEKTRMAMNQLKNAGMDLGAGLGPILLRTAEIVKIFATALNSMTPEQKQLMANVAQGIILFGGFLMVLGKAISMYGAYHKAITTVRTAGGIGAMVVKDIPLLGKLGGAIKAIGMAIAANPLGLLIIGIGLLVAGLIYAYNHCETFRNGVNAVFESIKAKTGPALARVGAAAQRFGDKIKVIAGRIKTYVTRVIGAISAFYAKHKETITTVLNAIGSVIGVVCELIVTYFSTAFSIIGDIFSTWINVAGDVIGFIVDVFTGNWAGAWEHVKQIFADIWDGIKNIFNDVIGGISAALDNIMGKASDAKSAANDARTAGGESESGSGDSGGNDGEEPGQTASGTNSWRGGLTYIHERGGELVDLPRGSRVYPHDKSLQMEYQRGQREAAAAGGGSITIAKLAETIVVHDKQDIDDIANALLYKLKVAGIDKMVGAI